MVYPGSWGLGPPRIPTPCWFTGSGPTDANSAGFVHGGVIMKLCDEVAAIAGVRHSRGRVVTAGMDRMTFNVRIEIGELLTLRASVNAVWRTSMEIGVRVEAERPAIGESRHTNTAFLTMVAVDEDGRPRAGPAAGVPDRRGAPARDGGADPPPQPARRARGDRRAERALAGARRSGRAHSYPP